MLDSLAITHSPLSSFFKSFTPLFYFALFMNNRIKSSATRLRPYAVKDDAYEKTQQGLAYTPAQMRIMSERGIPISTMMSAETFYDGDSSDNTDILIAFQRGVDSIDAWNVQQDARKRLASAHRKDSEIYGNPSSSSN